MALHDAKLVTDAELAAAAARLERVESMTETSGRPFRRKAALQSQAGEKPAPGRALAKIPQNRVLAPLPEPWLRLRRKEIGATPDRVVDLPLVNFHRDVPAARAFDILRTRLMQSLKDHGWKRVAIAAPTTGCGTTFTAVNLALSLSRVPGTRTILMDLNLRAPGIGSALDLDVPCDMRGFLRGDVDAANHILKCSDTLAVGLCPEPAFDAAELLHARASAEVLDQMAEDFGADAILYDLPAVLDHDDFAAFLPQVDGVLLVADGTRTTAAQLRACERILGEATPLLGVFLNRGRPGATETYAS
ncbi:MAG: CpsD/CapB family tyrosine-protein kinase [Pseudomonadota bacterium]